MTVGELIETLSAFDADLVVWQDGGGDPYCAGEITTAAVRKSHGRTMLGHAGSTPDEWLELG